MIFTVRFELPAFLRVPRRALAAFVIGIYLAAGAMHGFCDLDVANASNKTFVSIVDKNTGDSEKGAMAGHHCHGCFSVFVPTSITVAFTIEPTRDVSVAPAVYRRGLQPGLDPPPPKILS